MRSLIVFLSLSSFVACAVGNPPGDLLAQHKDGGIIAKGDGGSHDPPPSTSDDAGSNNPPPSSCTGTLCGTQCIDTTSDPSNCGACGVACASTETCSNGQCAPSTNTTSNAPPQGSCSHSLCTSGGALPEGCDTEGCTVVICDPSYLGDDYCCTTSWDSQCSQEVTDYCSPYSCQ